MKRMSAIGAYWTIVIPKIRRNKKSMLIGNKTDKDEVTSKKRNGKGRKSTNI